VDDDDFSSAAAADSFLTDKVLYFSGETNDLTIELTSDLSESGDGITFETEVAAPEPPAVCLMAFGFLSVSIFRLRASILREANMAVR
jgi:hypothetical protein